MMTEYPFSEKMKNLRPSAIREIFKSLTDPSIISFAAGNPSPQSFPTEEMARISAEIFATSAAEALQYSVTEGYTPLRDAVARRLKARFGIGRDFDTTVIVTGGQQGIELTCKVLCNEGDAVLCENPSFIGALNAFRSCGAEVVGVPMEDDGMDIAALERAIAETPRAKFIYLIPTFQNPSGITMSEEKRRAVYRIARKNGLLIFEDNPYGELRFTGEEIPTIKQMDTDGIVIYCSSFSKILSAGMRMGFVCAPDAIVQKMVVAKQSEDVHTNIFFQMLCYRYITECDLDAHIAEICTLYRRKCTLMLDALDRMMPKSVTYTRPEGGLFLWCTLPDSVPLDAFVKRAIEEKVAVVPGATFNCDPEMPSQSFRLNYSMPSDAQIETGVEALARVARSFGLN